MKRNRLNTILVLGLLGAAATAYGTCYLRQVVCCVKGGDSLGLHNTPGCANSTTIYADEDAWRWDLYSVSRGGRGGVSTRTAYCDGVAHNTNAYNDPFTGTDGQFTVYYVSACNGSDFTGTNPDSGGQIYYSVSTSYLPDNTASTCN